MRFPPLPLPFSRACPCPSRAPLPLPFSALPLPFSAFSRPFLVRVRSNVSAEIYVVCTGFLAPTQLDPKLLDGKHVFSELPDQIKRIDIFHPEVR